MKAKLTSVVLALLLVFLVSVPFSFESGAVSYDYDISVGERFIESISGDSTETISINNIKSGLYYVSVYCPTEDGEYEEADSEAVVSADFSVFDNNGNRISSISPAAYYNGKKEIVEDSLYLEPSFYYEAWYAFDARSSYHIEITGSGDSSSYLDYIILIQPVTFMSEYQFGTQVNKSLGNHTNGFCYLIPFTPKNASQAECYYEFYTNSKYAEEDNEYAIDVSILDWEGDSIFSDNYSDTYMVYDYQRVGYHLNPGEQHFIMATYSIDNPEGPDIGVDGLISWKVSLKALKSTGKLSVKSLWASQHSVGKVLFKWTKKDNTTVSGWNLKYRTRKIGGNNKWSGWTTKSYGKDTFQAWVKIPKDYVIEIHAQAKGDTTWSNGIITTPAGGKYQAMKTTYVKNDETGQRIGNTITLEEGETINVVPAYEYSIKNYTKRPRLYPNHMLYDVADRSVLNVLDEDENAYVGGMIDGVATLLGVNPGKTTIIFRSPNGRTQVTTVNVVASDE